MTETVGPGPRAGSALDSAAPRRAEGVLLIGEMAGSGYREPPALARRADGQTVQLTPLFYALLEALDGTSGPAELAADLSRRTGRSVSADNVVSLLDKLRPLGLVAGDGDTEAARSNPLLALRFKVAVTDPERTRRITDPFARLFHPVVVVPVLAGFAWVSWWVLFHKGLASATHDAFARPGLLLAVLAATVFSAGFHEFGHAAATRRGGATPGVMGAGLYLIWPAFYTDVTDSYRLGRGGRLRTDLGGLYFNAIVTLLTVGVWFVADDDAVLLVVATQVLQMLRQLLPLVRFDGYHVLADLTGVPDLYQRIGPTLKSLVPGLGRDPSVRALKPWARAVITLWVLTVVPLLAFTLVLMVVTLPRIVGTALHAADLQRTAMNAAADDGDVVAMVARGLSALVVLLPVAAIAYLLVRVGRRAGASLWRRTSGRPVRRVGAVLLVLAVAGALTVAWWPKPDRYRPVQAWERGTLVDAVQLARPATGFTVGSSGSGTVAWPGDSDLPTRDDPAIAVILVPHATEDLAPPGTTVDASDTSDEGQLDSDANAPLDGVGGIGEVGDVGQAPPDTWVFPIDEPLPPDADDTQAVAVNTTDGTAVYDVAFALIWADGDEPVQTDNEAYALASCSDCAAVAVSFQVVLVVDEAASVAPANIAVALNQDCSSCLTYALAVQLFVTLDGPLSPEAMSALAEVWDDIVAYGQNIVSVPLDQIQEDLSAFEDQILAIIEEDQGPLGPEQPSPSATASPSEATGSADAGTPTADASATDVPTPTDAVSATPSEPTATDGSSPASSAPSDTASPTSDATSDAASDPASPSASPTEAASPDATSTAVP